MDFDKIIKEAIADYESSEYIEWLKKLQAEYAPDIFMTEKERDILLLTLSRGTEEYDHPFTQFMEGVERQYRNKALGLTETIYFKGMTEKELMYAWLNPDCIKTKEN